MLLNQVVSGLGTEHELSVEVRAEAASERSTFRTQNCVEVVENRTTVSFFLLFFLCKTKLAIIGAWATTC